MSDTISILEEPYSDMDNSDLENYYIDNVSEDDKEIDEDSDENNDIDNELNSLLIYTNNIKEYEDNILTILNSINNKLSTKIFVKYNNKLCDFNEVLEEVHNNIIDNKIQNITFGQLLMQTLDSLDFK